jgi:hypothetical protein
LRPHLLRLSGLWDQLDLWGQSAQSHPPHRWSHSCRWFQLRRLHPLDLSALWGLSHHQRHRHHQRPLRHWSLQHLSPRWHLSNLWDQSDLSPRWHLSDLWDQSVPYQSHLLRQLQLWGLSDLSAQSRQ